MAGKEKSWLKLEKSGRRIQRLMSVFLLFSRTHGGDVNICP